MTQRHQYSQNIAMNLLKREKSFKGGINAKRLRAGWDNDYLLKSFVPDIECDCPSMDLDPSMYAGLVEDDAHVIRHVAQI